MSRYLFLITEINSANGICAKAVMRELLRKGHQVMCATNRLPRQRDVYYSQDGIDYYTVRDRWLHLLEQQIMASHDSHKKLLLKYIYFILYKLKLMLTYFTWPLLSPSYTYRYYKTARNLCSLNKVDYIVSIYSQIDALIAGHLIKRRVGRVKYIPYMLDPLAAGNGPRLLSQKWLRKRGMIWEKILFSNADLVLMMESSRGFYNMYKNTYHIEFAGLPLLSKIGSSAKYYGFSDNKINIVYVGSIPRNIRSPNHIIDVFSKITDERLALYFIGPIDNDYIKSKSLIDQRITILGTVSHEESLAAINSADFLLNLGNKVPNMVPSKIFELMSTGLPIVSVAQINDDSCKPYFLKYPNILMLDEGGSVDSDANKLVNFISGYIGKKLSFDSIVTLFKPNTPEYTANILTSAYSYAKEL